MKLNFLSKTALVTLIGLLAACSPSKTSEQYIASAQSFIDKGELNSALIEYKNAVRANPNNADLRQRLGLLQLEIGDLDAAEKELKVALSQSLNAGDTQSAAIIKGQLASVLAADSNFRGIIELVEEANSASTDALPEFKFYVAYATMNLEGNDEAKPLLEKLVAESEGSEFGQIAQVYVSLIQGEVEAAKTQLDDLIGGGTKIKEAFIVGSQIALSSGDQAGAIGYLESYLTLLPQDGLTKLELAYLYLATNQFADAERHVDAVLRIAPQHALSNFIKAQVAFQNRDFESAKRFMEISIQNGNNTYRARLVAAYSNFSLKLYEQARTHFEFVSQEMQQDALATKVYAMTNLALGEYDKTANALEGIESISEQDASFLSATSYQLWRAGEPANAEKVLNKMESLASDNPVISVRKGILYGAMTGEANVSEIEAALEIVPDLPGGKLALVGAYFTEKDYESALRVAKELQASEDTKLSGYNAAAKVYKELGQTAEMEDSYRQALAVDGNNLGSLLYFYQKYMAEENHQEALKYIELMVNRNPPVIYSMIAYYETQKLLGQAQKGLEKVESIYAGNKAPTIALIMGKVYFMDGQYERALEILNTLDKKALYNIAEYWKIKASSYMMLKQPEKAAAVYVDWTRQAPRLFESWLSMGNFFERFGHFGRAINYLEDAEGFFEPPTRIHALKAYFYLKLNDVKSADQLISNLPAEETNYPFVAGIKGQVLASKRQFDEALPLLIKQYESAATIRGASRIFIVYVSSGKAQQGIDFIYSHLESYPVDIATRKMLADYFLNSGRNAEALAQYKVLNEYRPNDLLVLNNLAWLLHSEGSSAEANKVIDKALSLAKDNVKLIETASEIKLALGNKNEAKTILNHALTISPDNQEIKRLLERANGQ